METFSKASGWDLDMRQISQGDIGIDFKFVGNPNISILKVGFDQAVHQRGIAPRGALTFGVPLDGVLDWYGGNAEQAAMMNFNHESGFDTVSIPGFSAFTFSLAGDFFESAARSLGVSIPDHVFKPPSGSIFRKTESSGVVRKILIDLLDARTRHLDTEFESDLVSGVLNMALESSGHADTAPLFARARVVRSAINFIEDNRYEPVTVKEICESTGTSVRTLDRAFKDRFGIGPKAYIKRRRLIGVRQALLRQRNVNLISDLANEWGFWHMGQFARDYRNLFGELPSETLIRR